MPRSTVTALLLVGFTVLVASGAVEPETPRVPTSIDGTWRWTFTMPDGATSRPKLVLESEEGRLSGMISFRPGTETAITNAVLDGSRVQFQVVRQRAGREIVTTYSGTWSGKVIRGKVESNWAGAPQVYDWEALRAHEGAEGLWRWTASFRGRRFEARVKLEQNGELLTGSVPGSGRGPRRIYIQNGSVIDNEVYFEIERGAGATKVLTIYRGKQTADTIKGTIQTVAGGRTTEAAWLARRPE